MPIPSSHSLGTGKDNFPNLLMADNYLKLISIYKKMERDDKAVKMKGYGEDYLSQSLKHVKTEWALMVRKEFGR